MIPVQTVIENAQGSHARACERRSRPKPSKGIGARLVWLLCVCLPVACSVESQTDAQEKPAVEAILEVLLEPDDFARARRLSTLLPTLGSESVPEARRALESPAVDRRAVEIALLLRFWATHDPAGASDWALSRSPRGLRSSSLAVAIETWARADPNAALAWIRATPPSTEIGSEAIEVALIRGWFDSNHSGLEDYIRNLGPSFERQRALASLARRSIQRNGPGVLVSWAEALPDEPRRFKLAAFRQVASELAQRTDPAAAVAWCEAHCDGPFGSNVRKLVAMRWAARDGPAAFEWLATAPAGAERDRAVQDAFLAWLRTDREAALGWVEASSSEGIEPWLRPALDLYAVSISDERPIEALSWAAQINDDTRRETAFIAIARRWREQDPSAAEAWVEQSPLSEKARERVRTPAHVPAQPTLEPIPGEPAL